MTLIVACYTPTGIAVSGDSRTTGTRTETVVPAGAKPGAPAATVQVPWVVSDSTRKVFCIQDRFAVATWGEAFINGLPVGHHVNEFILSNADANITTTEGLGDAILLHFRALSATAGVMFLVAGYDGADPYVVQINISGNAKQRVNWDAATSAVTYNSFYGGDWDIAGRLVGGSALVAWHWMNLQDAVDLTRHLIRTTIDQMKFEARVPTVGGPIDTITVTPSRCRFLVRKELHA